MTDGPLQSGVLLGKYRIERQLGRGGMGTVFLVYDEALALPAALKGLGSSTDVQDIERRVLREARSASSLNHPNICTVYEVGEHSGWTFIAMEYVDGEPVSDL